MSSSRKSDQPCRSHDAHAPRRHRVTLPAAAAPPPLAGWSRLGAALAARARCPAVAQVPWPGAPAFLASRRVAAPAELPPVDRIGPIAWLACVALHDEERAA